MKLRKWIETSVIVFFCVMAALLVSRNLPRAEKDQVKLGKINIADEKLERDNWMGIYMGEKKIGYSHLNITKTTYEGKDAYCVTDETFMKFKYDYQSYDANVNAKVYVRTNMRPLSFSISIFTDVYRAVIEGKAKGDKMEVVMDSGGSKTKKEFPITAATYLPSSVDMLLVKQDLEIGKPYRIDLFDPQILSGEYMTVTLKRKEKLNNEEILVVEKDYKGLVSTSWMNMKGEVIKEENALGMKMITESKEMALSGGKFEAGELVSKASISSNVFIKAARSISYLKVRMRGLKGFIMPPSKRQAVSGSGGEIILEINSRLEEEENLAGEKFREYTMPSMLVQSNEPEIVNTAIDITEDDTLPWEKAKHLNRWAFNNIKKVPTFSLPSAINVMKEKRGDCNEHAVLLVALCRACRIPARAVAGVVYMPPSGLTVGKGDNGSFFYHAWVEVNISGGWKMLDPTFGQNEVDAAHIKLLDGDIEKQAELVRLIGNLVISVEEYK
ncbi:hypothetical protein COY52_07485 [Candidatus Desantisbacteria bacterium CG_4_10_14_0_8_um_filter_48_22]|uniref:Transglutaminase-like domain-containing protein n=1 Tax=Candidatus Desantisbacteria bacterium CG_4_10_14_0_8_um_filter_48_22 TaxID=1974543 RepID=A0A2M7SA06_9BACT|nr:MAG: hypothetical protein AUJ67_07915 [Candidatus Desantisbacteria bacterium CG1_02_49_89]PIV54737.1 MAG: hypothetical protein COS16_09375 [Candidatus Desantisbacteria bacterium CG02_land_8_20_14_3_00_49_13]PIZ16289.1 MAG: hypothetical protein COY52_07485 [Candidatus Desantisbacteria bacterium CG_4_10_14_0_8_um_filter_48_22]PJB28043.1 MAG: hypothetical protein CO111_02560 [Candidatus Desantisbacteria bacterium CG_4_9_14_3_um_filter_50_7]